ncbi:MAG TPA: lectin-like protein [Luteolibacter sp.]
MSARFLALTALVPCLASAGELFTAPFGEGGTWNLYQRIERNVTWDDARRLAGELPAPAGNPALAGHLVTFSSLAENDFMRQVASRASAWCGLTDDERFGGEEAGANPSRGWKWITGEPLTFTHWRPAEPDNWSSAGEDAVLFNSYGLWTDKGNGLAGQMPDRAYFVVEWETRSPTAVKGAIPLTPAWPEGVEMPPPLPGKWNARWATGIVPVSGDSYGTPQTLTQAAGLFMKPGPTHSQISDQGRAALVNPWLWVATRDSARQGWLASSNGAELSNFPGLPQTSRYIAAASGKLQVEKAGSYTFAVTAEDAFALRIGGLNWKASYGQGYIDPLDPRTFTQPYGDYSTKALGVIDLPAGEVTVEALWMVESTGSEFHVLSAPGVYETEGATTDWRPLGHVRSTEPVPKLGVTAAGWTIDSSRQRERAKGASLMTLREGLLELELDLDRVTLSGVASVNFADHPTPSPARFPDAKPFPNREGMSRRGDWPLRARAKLVVPKSGSYQIGLHAAGEATLRIKGGELMNIAQAAQGRKDLYVRPDSFDFNGQVQENFEPKVVTTWFLQQGECEIEVFYVKHGGPASLAIFSNPAGPYGPGLLTAGDAKLEADVPGLPHTLR